MKKTLSILCAALAEVCITNFGGRIVSIMVPDKNGEYKDVVLGFSKVQDYFPEHNASDFGAAIGRYANRITSDIASTAAPPAGSIRCMRL